MGYEKQVAAGIAFLDEDVPGWRADLDIKTVRMHNACYCILGQIYGEFWNVVTLCAPMPSGKRSQEWAADHGFDVDLSVGNLMEEYGYLWAEWHRQLA